MRSEWTQLTEALVKAVPVEHCSLHPTEVSTTQFIISCRPSSVLKDLDAYTAEEEQDKQKKGRKRKTEPKNKGECVSRYCDSLQHGTSSESDKWIPCLLT